LGTATDRPVGSSRSAPRFPFLSTALLTLLLVPLSALAASNVRVRVDGRTISLPTARDTVREALADAKVTLDKDDLVSPGLEQAASSESTITVTRVSYREGGVDEKIPYRTIVRPPAPGNRPYHPTVTREGRAGVKRTTYRVKIVDGQEAERVAIGETIVREPVHEIVISRKPQLLGSRGAYAGLRTLSVVASAYDPGPGSCPGTSDGKTCNGKRAGYGIIAVDPKVIPLGSKIYVPGYGYGIAADVGSAIQGNRIDLGYNSRRGALKWGKKPVRITIVD
jgi:3D (Asp-Asp-Asp) domain-containing protein